MGATIRDVAKKVGVSTASVSLVLNNKECRIPSETKQKIFDAAKELNYITKKERILANKKTDGYIIGVIYPMPDDELTEDCISSMESYTAVYGYHVIQMFSLNTSSRCIEQIRMATDLGVDGLIVFPPLDMNTDGNNIKIKETLEKIDIPYLLMDRAIYQVFSDFVTADYKLCAGMATNQLISQGFNHIGIIADKRDMFNTAKYIKGFKEELLLNGIESRDDFIFYRDDTPESIHEGVKEILSKGVTALISCNKSIALGIYDFAKKNNLKIGEDFSLISIGDLRESECLNPSLTCVKLPGKQMGLTSIEVIMSRIEKTDVGAIKTHYFTPTIKYGESVKGLA